MDFAQHQADMLQHYNWLVLEPGFRQYTQDRVTQMAADCPSLYADFPRAVKATLTAANEARRAQAATKSVATEGIE